MRRIQNGEIMFKSQMSSSIAQIIVASIQEEQESVLITDISGKLELFNPPTETDIDRRKTGIQNEAVRKIENKKDAFDLELNVLNKTQIKQLSISDCIEQSAIPRTAKIEAKLLHTQEHGFN